MTAEYVDDGQAQFYCGWCAVEINPDTAVEAEGLVFCDDSCLDRWRHWEDQGQTP